MKDALAPPSPLGPADESLQRLAIGLAVSFFVHLLVLIAAALLLASSQGSADYVTITVGDAATPAGEETTEDDRLEEATQHVEPPKPRESRDVPLAVDVQEKADRIAQALSESAERDAREFANRQQDHASENQRAQESRSGELKGIGERVSGNLGRRGSFEGLEPRSFYGVQVHTRRVIFVLDTSGSMNVEFARLNLRNAYRDLPPEAYFGIVLYNQDVQIWKRRLVQASAANKREADNFLKQISSEGATNIYDALRAAFEMSRRSVVRADTIFFLTDGFPNRGRIVDPAGILAEVRKWNSNESVHVNAIHLLGPSSGESDEKVREAIDFMKRLAREHNGTYVARR